MPTEPCEFVGVAEAADLLGVSRTRVGSWHRAGVVRLADGRRVLFPKPICILRATPVWLQADMERLRDARNAPADIKAV